MSSIESTTLSTIDQSFFFNDQYDDHIIYQEMLNNRRKNYFNCIKEERRINDYNVYTLKLSQFIINEDINTKYGLAEGSLSYYIDYSDDKSNSVYDVNIVDPVSDTVISYMENFSILPYYNKKKFIDKFGKDSIITLEDIYSNHDIFRYSILCQMNSMYFFGLQFIEDTNGCYLVIELDKNKGIGNLDSLYKKFGMHNEEKYLEYFGEDVNIRIFYQNHNEIFHTYKAKHLLFEKTDTEYAYLDLSIFKEISKFDKPSDCHKWMLYITNVIDEKNLMIAIPAEEVIINNKSKIRIPIKPAKMIQNSVANCNCYLLNQYNQVGSHIFDISKLIIGDTQDDYDEYVKVCIDVNNEDLPEYTKYIVLQLLGTKVPIQKLRVFAYYEDTGTIGDLVADTINQSKYLYDSQSILDSIDTGKIVSPLSKVGFEPAGLILYITNPDAYTTTKFYMEWYESDVNICEYDYPNRDIIECYKKNYIRDFMFDSVNNPKFLHYFISPLSEYSNERNKDLRLTRYQLLTEVLHESIDRHKSLASKLYQKNKNSIRKVYRQEDYPNIFKRSVFDNKDVIHDINDLVAFNDEMMYITVNLSEYIKPSALIFVNGIRINTDLIYVDRKTAYIFFKKKYLKKEKNVIDVEVFLYDTNPDHKIDDTISFYSTGISTTIPNNDKYDRMSIKNLMLYDKRTKRYLDGSEVSFRYKLGVVELAEPNDNENYYEFLFDPEDLDYYMTHHNEFFIDDNQTFLMVRKESVLYDCPLTYKKLNMENVYIKLLSSHRINHELGITNTNNYRKLFVDDGLKSATITMKNFKEVSNKERFRVYYGGKLMGDTEYSITLPNKYDDDVSISINNISTLDNSREIILEYLPVEEFLYCDGIPNSEEWIKNGFDEFIIVNQSDSVIHLTDKYILNTDMLKVYIDGYRIPNDEIIQLPGGNYFIFKGLIPGKRLTVYIDAHDDGLYQSEKAINPIGYSMENDLYFREYQINKYTK